MADPRALLQKADKQAASAGGGFSFFGGRTEKWEAAVELYTQAGNAFRLQKSPLEAGKCFEKAAKIQRDNLSEPDDAANTMAEAFKVYRQDDPEKAAECLEQAINHYTLKGNFRRAATNKQNLAELYEVGIGDQKRALEAYETAAGWYESDNAEALSNKLLLKVADLSALESDYYKAISCYEKVAKSSLNNNLMKYSVKEYYLKAGICHLATADMIGARRALTTYQENDHTFSSTRECQLLNDLAEAVEQGDQESFADKLYQFDQMSKLDKWKTTMLLRVKESVEKQEEDFS